MGNDDRIFEMFISAYDAATTAGYPHEEAVYIAEKEVEYLTSTKKESRNG